MYCSVHVEHLKSAEIFDRPRPHHPHPPLHCVLPLVCSVYLYGGSKTLILGTGHQREPRQLPSNDRRAGEGVGQPAKGGIEVSSSRQALQQGIRNPSTRRFFVWHLSSAMAPSGLRRAPLEQCLMHVLRSMLEDPNRQTEIAPCLSPSPSLLRRPPPSPPHLHQPSAFQGEERRPRRPLGDEEVAEPGGGGVSAGGGGVVALRGRRGGPGRG